MDFQLLGPVGATAGRRRVDLGPPRQRCVLAVLLVEAGSAVPTEQLIDRLWEQHPPREARSTLYSYVTRIRAVLQSSGAAAEGVALVRRAGGYLLDVPPEQVDLNRFRRLVKDGRAAGGERAGSLLRRALALWKADALTGVPGMWAERTRAQLEDERVMAYLAYADNRVDGGRYEELLPGLRALAASHPFDERLTARLMTVLERCGRQAEALHLYERVRTQLAEQLGVDPGPELRRRHLELLSSAPVPALMALVPRQLPRQLPMAPTGFQGRARELAELNRAAGTDGLIVALVGPGGVGKTSLALHWAHRSLDRFPDGQLYANLRGFSPAGEHLPASTVLRDFLEALGVEPSAIPPGGDARAALYRSLIAGRRMLVVLDDVRDAAEVTPLLPGSLTCTVVLTSRHRLAGLAVAYGTSVVSLDVLSPGEARTLLSRRIGAARVETEARTVTSLLEYCGGLPLALGVLASRATAHPEFPLSMLAEELEEESDRLDALDAGDAGVRAVFASSYRALSPIAARAFGLLGCAPGPSIGLPAIAALLGLPIPRARTVVRMLEAAHLVQQHAPARYRMHDLVRLYAMEVAGRDVPADAREAALRRLVGFYLRGAYAAGRLLYPHRVDIEPAACGDGVVPPPMGTAGQALAWCDTEYVGVLAAFRLAAAHTWDDAAWRLAWALDAYCLRRAHLADLVEIWTVATRAVDRLGEPLPRAAARWRLGLSRAIFGERDGVLGLLRTAVALFARAGAAGCQAQVHQSIGLVMSRWKEHEPALHHARRALAMSRTLGNVNGEANALNSMAWCLSQLRRYDLALPHAERALWLFRGGDDPDGEAAALDSMGYIVHQMGRYREAIGYYTSAIRKRRMIGNVGQEPDSLVRIGDSYAALGESCHARAAWRRALALYRRQHRVSEAEQVQARFDGARPPWRPPRPSARHGPSRAAPPASC